ncbi:hypothetical protein ACFVGX_01160 [Streptomyces sp. NPDC127113]
MLNLAIDAPARVTDRVSGEPAAAGANAITTPKTRPEALPC